MSLCLDTVLRIPEADPMGKALSGEYQVNTSNLGRVDEAGLK